MNKKLAGLIKTARTNAGFTQQGLANMVPGLSAADLGKAERNEKDLTQDQLKAIAKATGVTQKSLLEAAGSAKSSAKTSSSSKTCTSKTSTSKTSTSKTSTSKTSASTTSMKVTAAEKKLVELYREASADDKKAVMNLLKGKETTTSGSDIIGTLLESAVGALIK